MPHPHLIIENGPAGSRWLRLSRPERRNALDVSLALAVRDALAADPSVPVLLGSADPQVFCAGADLTISDAERAAVSDLIYDCCETIITRPGPVIAVLTGAAVGGGAQLAAASDLRIASPAARLRWTGPPGLNLAVGAWLLPDLIGYRLTREIGAEWTNASTTGLTDARTRAWSRELTARLGIPDALLPPLRSPGDRIGGLLPRVARDTGLAAGLPVVTVGSHDTAPAVAAVPAAAPEWPEAIRSRTSGSPGRWDRRRPSGCRGGDGRPGAGPGRSYVMASSSCSASSGTTVPIGSRITAVAAPSYGVRSRLTITRPAPARAAITQSDAAGSTVSVLPIASSRSQLAAAMAARR